MQVHATRAPAPLFRYIGATEDDFEWLTDQIVQIANRCCSGRLVSVLEGGYNLRGGIVSAFARSVAAHVRALADPHSQVCAECAYARVQMLLPSFLGDHDSLTAACAVGSTLEARKPRPSPHTHSKKGVRACPMPHPASCWHSHIAHRCASALRL